MGSRKITLTERLDGEWRYEVKERSNKNAVLKSGWLKVCDGGPCEDAETALGLALAGADMVGRTVTNDGTHP